MVATSGSGCEHDSFVCCETEYDFFLFTGDVGFRYCAYTVFGSCTFSNLNLKPFLSFPLCDLT